MGCNTVDTDENYDSECDPDETPYHLVSLSPYKIDIYEVTVGEYKKCVNLGYCKSENFNSSWNYGHNRDLHPMNGVSYYGAKEYCEHLGLRLPTEAEWEYAARGVDGIIYPWGNDSLSCEYATYNNGSNGCGTGTTSKVGSKPLGVSPNGVYDMVGNVWEWVSDYYQEDYYTSELMVDPTGPEIGTQRVVHGGGWDG